MGWRPFEGRRCLDTPVARRGEARPASPRRAAESGRRRHANTPSARPNSPRRACLRDKDPHLTDSPAIPSTGAYYWLPIPPLRSLTWRVLTCHDLGLDADTSHLECWPGVVPHLAAIWGRDPKAIQRRLGRHCYGIPRGRVTPPERTYLILHGADSPIPGWVEAVVRAFGLNGRRVRPLLDEHERTLPGDVRAIAGILGPFPTPAGVKARSVGP